MSVPVKPSPALFPRITVTSDKCWNKVTIFVTFVVGPHLEAVDEADHAVSLRRQHPATAPQNPQQRQAHHRVLLTVAAIINRASKDLEQTDLNPRQACTRGRDWRPATRANWHPQQGFTLFYLQDLYPNLLLYGAQALIIISF